MRNKDEFKALIEERAAVQRHAAALAARKRKIILQSAAVVVLGLAILPLTARLLDLPFGDGPMADDAPAERDELALEDEMAEAPSAGTAPEAGNAPTMPDEGDREEAPTDPEEPEIPEEPDPMLPPGFEASDPNADLTAHSPAELLTALSESDCVSLSEESVTLLSALLQNDYLTLPDGEVPFCALYSGNNGYFMLKLTWAGEDAMRLTLLFDGEPFFTEEWLKENYLPVEAAIPLYQAPSNDRFYRSCLSERLLAEIEISDSHTDPEVALLQLVKLCKEFQGAL